MHYGIKAMPLFKKKNFPWYPHFEKTKKVILSVYNMPYGNTRKNSLVFKNRIKKNF